MAAAFLRAMHPVVDEPPLVFDDPVAQEFLPGYQRRYLRRLGRLPRRWLRVFRQRRSALGSMRAQILVRSRWAEDALAQARAGDGVARHVVLAAGLDTFAWRQGAGALPVIEVDHPATQRWKRSTLERRGQSLPAELRFLSVDFERQRLQDVLDRIDAAQFVTWLGTSYYLSRGAIAATLAALAEQSASGSLLALDYWSEAPLWRPDAALLLGTRIATAAQREPLRSLLRPTELEGMAREAGWRVVEQCPADAQNLRYLQGRRDDLAVPAFAHLALLQR